MNVGPETVGAAPKESTLHWRSDNPLVRAVARVPLPIRVKQLIGTVAVAALLALVAVLGLVALGRSNSRGTVLRTLQQQGGYEQLLLTDATQLKEALDYRLNSVGNGLPPPGVAGPNRATTRLEDRWYASAQDQTISNEFDRLCLDAGVRLVAPVGNAAAKGPGAVCLGTTNRPVEPAAHLPLTLKAVAPSLWRNVVGCAHSRSACSSDLATPAFAYGPRHGSRPVDLFFALTYSTGGPQWSRQFSAPIPASSCGGGCATHALLVRADRWAASFAAQLASLTRKTRIRADALVASDRGSYSDSRELLIGAGAGSFLLALAIGLLLSDSLLVPLRKMQKRLATIAAGDFSGRLDVPNRDEIGTLAEDVNRMTEELHSVYRELELVSERKSRYVMNMSHELRTPLNAIIGFSEVLHEQMFGELNERQLAYVEDVLGAGKHLLSLINELLDLAKIEAGRMQLHLSQVAVPTLLQSAVSLHDERAARAGISLRLTSDPDEITVTADERRILQVVVNLISNAVKFTPASGRVDVSARLVDDEVEIAVADTGPGIAPEELETIFEEFTQTSEGKQAEGTGLGLPLSRQLVELHGGRLWVESAPGHGSTFRFILPVRQEARVAEPLDRSPAAV